MFPLALPPHAPLLARPEFLADDFAGVTRNQIGYVLGPLVHSCQNDRRWRGP